MTTLVEAVNKYDNDTTTENGARAKKSTLKATVDLFYNIGASRGTNINPAFAKAYKEDEDVAVRIAQWARDVRGGAGERQLFRDILRQLAESNPEVAKRLIPKVPEIGRWDDLLVLYGTSVQTDAFNLIAVALRQEDGLCAKWMPRKGEVAAALRNHLGLYPRAYRKTLVNLTNVVEQKMCAKKWRKIEYGHVPSLAASRYHKAFEKNDTTRYLKYVSALEKGEEKINAGAVYPYDVVKSLRTNHRVANQQWKALPDYVPEGKSFLPVVDVSGSMGAPVGNNKNVSCLDVAVSLGLYLSERNKSVFKDSFVTFSAAPSLETVSGTLQDRVQQMSRSRWQMNTDLEAVFKLLLNAAVKNKVAQKDMPETIIILSDMQFDQCCHATDSGLKMIKRKYKEAGYNVPDVVFWNLRATGNVPASHNKKGVSLVSGFSPSLMKTLLKDGVVTPEQTMLDTVMTSRYDW